MSWYCIAICFFWFQYFDNYNPIELVLWHEQFVISDTCIWYIMHTALVCNIFGWSCSIEGKCTRSMMPREMELTTASLRSYCIQLS